MIKITGNIYYCTYIIFYLLHILSCLLELRTRYKILQQFWLEAGEGRNVLDLRCYILDFENVDEIQTTFLYTQGDENLDQCEIWPTLN